MLNKRITTYSLAEFENRFDEIIDICVKEKKPIFITKDPDPKRRIIMVTLELCESLGWKCD